MSSIWKDLHLNPRVESCFTCLRRLSSFLSTFKLLSYQPPNEVASLLFSFALDCHLELMFQYDRICQLKALPHRVQDVFWQEWGSNPRTLSRTRVLDWGFSWAWRLRSLAHSASFPSTHFFFDLWPFHWVNFSIPRCILLKGLCHPFEKFFVQTHAYIRVAHVFAGYLLFCALLKRSAFNHGWRSESFVFFCFGLSSWIDVPVRQNLSAKGSASSCSKRFLTGVGFEPTHRLVYLKSRLRNFLSRAP